jgi:hypothetical protein
MELSKRRNDQEWMMKNQEWMMKKLGIRRLDATLSHLVKRKEKANDIELNCCTTGR